MLEKSAISKQNSFSGAFKIFVSLTVTYFLSPRFKVCQFSISALYVGFEVVIPPVSSRKTSEKSEGGEQ